MAYGIPSGLNNPLKKKRDEYNSQTITRAEDNRQGGDFAYGLPGGEIAGRWGDKGNHTDFSGHSDADVRLIQSMRNQNTASGAGLDAGVDQNRNNAVINAALGRIGLKNALGQSIAGNAGAEAGAQGILKQEADVALKEGLGNTRKNFNRRGLLYSGMREGGEGSVKSSVASKLASDSSSTSRDFANQAAKQKEAYAAIGLQNQQQNLELANQAFDTTMRNSIARQQAYQQLGEGVGQAGGLLYGSRGKADTVDASVPESPYLSNQTSKINHRSAPYLTGDY